MTDPNAYGGDPLAWCREVAEPIAAKHACGLTNYGTRLHSPKGHIDIPCFSKPERVERMVSEWLEG